MGLVIITGMSGAGKSTTKNIFEDMGYHCISNMPPRLFPEFAQMYLRNEAGASGNVALLADMSDEECFRDFLAGMSEFKRLGINCTTFFLDASDDTLLRRYKETRRRHPLANDDNVASLEEAFALERKLLEGVKECADFIFDTSKTNISQYRERVLSIINKDFGSSPLHITCISFGFKNGLPAESDLVFDVRCLPNPYYLPELKEHDGCEKCISDYVFSFESSQKLLEKLIDMIDFLIPLYIREGKCSLVIAIGCTGGRHRSVALTESLAAHFSGDFPVSVLHRDKDRR